MAGFDVIMTALRCQFVHTPCTRAVSPDSSRCCKLGMALCQVSAPHQLKSVSMSILEAPYELVTCGTCLGPWHTQAGAQGHPGRALQGAGGCHHIPMPVQHPHILRQLDETPGGEVVAGEGKGTRHARGLLLHYSMQHTKISHPNAGSLTREEASLTAVGQGTAALPSH